MAGDAPPSKRQRVSNGVTPSDNLPDNLPDNPSTEHSTNPSDSLPDDALNAANPPAEAPSEQTSEQKPCAASVAASVASEAAVVVQWPWIAINDPASSKEYFFNALTNQSSWEIPTSDISATTAQTSSQLSSLQTNQRQINEPTAIPSSSEAASSMAQKAWEQYWQQWRTAQAEAGNLSSPSLPGIPAGPSLGVSEGATVGAQMQIYIEHHRSPTARELGRPARQQVKPPESTTVAYTQGSEEYNIWYGKHLSDRWENGRRDDREKATSRCNPFADSGWTRADIEPPLDRPIICLYFARGCCYLGSKCRYYHRVPTAEDNDKLDELHDIFGRERFASHRDDMTGVGSFTEDCRTLFVGDLKVHRVHHNAEEKTEQLIRQQFGVWGPLEEIKVIRNRNLAFVKYEHRVSAEFAKVAMAEQKLLLDSDDDQICVRWAHPGRDSGKKSAEQAAKDWELANKALMKRLEQLGYSQDDLECFIRWEIQEAEKQGAGVRPMVQRKPEASVVAQYPNTDERVAAVSEMPNKYSEMKKYSDIKKIMTHTTGSGAPVPLSQQAGGEALDDAGAQMIQNIQNIQELETTGSEQTVDEINRMNQVFNRVGDLTDKSFEIDI